MKERITMKNRIMGAVEVNTVQRNLESIEEHLGRDIPPGVLSADDLKDHILSALEVHTICTNINSISQSKRKKKSSSSAGDFDLVQIGETICMWAFFLLIFLYTIGVLK